MTDLPARRASLKYALRAGGTGGPPAERGRISDADLKALPAVLLVALRCSGKTQTLRSWAAHFRFRVVDRQTGEQDAEAADHELVPFHETGAASRTGQVQDYVAEVGGRLLRIIDVPGEIVDDATPRAGTFRAALARLAPRLRAVVVFATPPVDLPEVRVPRGKVTDVAQFGPDAAAAVPLDKQASLAQLHRALTFAEGTASLLGTALESCAVVVQVGFADLTDLAGDADALERYRRTCEPVWATGAHLTFEPRAVEARLRGYGAVSELAAEAFPWIRESALRSWTQLEPAIVLQSNRDRLGLGKHTRVMGLLRAADATLGREVVRGARRARRRRAAALAAFAASILAAVAGVVHVARGWFPQLLPAAVAERSCLDTDVGAAPERRCACLDLLLRASPEHDATLRARMVERFRTACGDFTADALPRDGALLAAVVQADLAHGLAAPADLCPSKLRAAVRAALPLPRGRPAAPWYPATTPGEVAAVTWLHAALGGAPASSPREVLGLLGAGERARYGAFARMLEAAAARSDCFTAWARARGGEPWSAVARACRAPRVALPAAVAARLIADVPGRPPALRVAAEPSPGDSCGVELATLVLEPPEADWLTTLNLAVLGPGRAAEILKEGPSPPAAVGQILALLQPDAAYGLRLQLAAALGPASLREASDFLRLPWEELETGARHGFEPRPDGRVAVLPATAAPAAACALLGLPEDGLAADVHWDDVPPLTPDHVEVLRARLALQLAGAGRSPRAALARGVATLRIYRAAARGPGDPTAVALRTALEPLTALADTEAPARSALCEAAAEEARDGEVDAHLRWFALRAEAGPAMRSRGATCAAQAVLAALARGDHAAARRVLTLPTTLAGVDTGALLAAVELATAGPEERFTDRAKPVFDALIARFGERARLRPALDRALRALQ